MSTVLHVAGPAIVSAFVSLTLSYVLVRIDPRVNLTAEPRSDRWHTKATPNSGGVAIFLACAAAYLWLARGEHLIIATGSTAMWMLGVVDDRVRLRPTPKLLAQMAIVTMTVLGIGVRELTPWPVLNFFITVVWALGITNAFNLIDNMDGLCAGVTVIIAGAQAIVLGMNGDLADARLFGIIAAAFAGFLALNYSPARIFMGDSGSMFAGFSLSLLTLATPFARNRLVAGGVLYPLLLFTYPLFDTVLVSVLRRMCGRPISQGGRDHSSHRLVSIGLNERHVTWLFWGLTLLGTAVGLLAASMPLYAMGGGVILIIFVTVLGVFLATLPTYPLNVVPQVSRISRWLPHINGAITALVDCCAVGLALILAATAAYDARVLAIRFRDVGLAVMVTMICHLVVVVAKRDVVRVNWTYFSLPDIFPIVGSVLITTAASYFLLSQLFGVVIPTGVLLVFTALSITLIVWIRSSLRVIRELISSRCCGTRRIAIFGTGDSAAAVLSMLRATRFTTGIPVMLLTDDERCTRDSIGGLRAYTIDRGIERLQARHDCSAILFPEGSAPMHTREIVKQLCLAAELEFLSVDLRVRAEREQPALNFEESLWPRSA